MAATGDSASFRFVALELPWILGPAEGRYVLRGHAGETSHVLFLEIVAAPLPRRRRVGRLLRRRAREDGTGPAPPATVPITRAILVDAAPLASEDAAQAWLTGADPWLEAQRAVDVLNGVLHAERVVRADPLVREVALEHAIAARVGVGRGAEVAIGRWLSVRRLALERPPGGAPSRRVVLRRRDRLTALLSGRDVAPACEELALRARLDLDRGRSREAALQLRIAVEAALAELPAWARHADVAAHVAELRDALPLVVAAADLALQGGLDPARIADVERVLGRLEAALGTRVAHSRE